MSKENSVTLEVYEACFGYYLNGESRRCALQPGRVKQKRAEHKKHIGRLLENLSPNPAVLEIGAGSGNDTMMLKELGCRVTATDGAQSSVDYMRGRGIDATKMNILKVNIKQEYNLVYANNVFVHFTSSDVVSALYRIYGAIRPRGLFIFDVLNIDADGGKKSGWIDLPGDYSMGVKRYFHYWRNTEIMRYTEEAGFIVKDLSVDGGDDGRRWIRICAKKP